MKDTSLMFSRPIKKFFTLLFVFLISACSNTKSTFDFDSSVDFSRIKTYTWDKQPSSAFAKANSLIDKRIVKSIEANLSRKGISQADSGDIKISYSMSTQQKLKSSNISAGVGMSVGRSNRGSISLSSGNQLRQTTEGTLVIDMVSAKDNSLIWRSITTQPISDRKATPQDSQKRMDQLMYGIFENFPPAQK
jgi:hypothetical protein